MEGIRFLESSRRLIAWLALVLASTSVFAGTLTAARMWPSPDYTRIALESATPLSFKYFSLENPYRLVVDIDGIEPNSVLEELSGQIQQSEPFIASVRYGINRPGVMRVVFELKAPVKPSVFALKPLAEYGHRLVIDLYSANAPDIAQILARSATPTTQPENKQFENKSNTAAPAYTRLMMIALDAGHGGEDPGAKGASGSHEKDITLSIARKLKQKIDAQPNMRAYLTRDGDYFVPLGDRVKKARAAKADLFVSIHADAFIRPEARGSSVFALSENGATSAAARWLAKRENEADLIGGINIDVKDQFLKRTLIDLSQTATINDSLRLGNSVLKQIGGINTLHKDDVEQAGFAVLKAPDIPSILVETAFISNPEEEKKLTDDTYQDKLADAILTGIKSYFEKNPHRSGIRVAKEM